MDQSKLFQGDSSTEDPREKKKSKVGKERVFERCREYLMGEAREKSCRPHPEPAASQAPAHTVVCVVVSQSKHGNGNASFFFWLKGVLVDSLTSSYMFCTGE